MSITERKNKNNKTVYDVAFMYKGVRYKRRGFSTKTQARDWETDVKSQVMQNGHYYTPCKKTFLEVFYEAFEIEKEKKKFKPNTIRSYNKTINHIKQDKIASMAISDLNYKLIQNYFNKIASKYSENSCREYLKCFKMTFKYAMRNNYIKNNPMPYIECRGKDKKSEKKTITYDEFCKIINYFENDKPLQIALYIGYYTGIRVGEVIALEKSDIDFKKHTISVTKNYDYESRQLLKPKTESSIAILPLAPQLESILIEWFNESPYEIVFSYDGNYASYGMMAKKFRDMGTGFHFHMLRHTFTSNLISSGADIKTTQMLLRHANVQTTLDVYAHSDIEKQRETINKIFETTPKLPQNLIN